jgi:metal-responsive CopG/Arc/MetJ family transcriptional regulator
MSRAMSIRLSDKTRRSVTRLAKAGRRSQSEVVREAIETFVEKAVAQVPPDEGWKHLVGILKGGPSDLSERTGQKVAKILQERYDRQGR